ncbi:hypothetical protein SNEBB_007260 [Seison nebaliae]|nr:hypothetical protein SNEBB_007260 [Seison nebaliae]
MDTGKYSSGTEMDQSMESLPSTDQDSMDNDPKRPRRLSSSQTFQSSSNMSILEKRNEFVDNVEPIDSENIIQECYYEEEYPEEIPTTIETEINNNTKLQKPIYQKY